jgi:hypothetical protein
LAGATLTFYSARTPDPRPVASVEHRVTLPVNTVKKNSAGKNVIQPSATNKKTTTSPSRVPGSSENVLPLFPLTEEPQEASCVDAVVMSAAFGGALQQETAVHIQPKKRYVQVDFDAPVNNEVDNVADAKPAIKLRLNFDDNSHGDYSVSTLPIRIHQSF